MVYFSHDESGRLFEPGKSQGAKADREYSEVNRLDRVSPFPADSSV